MVADGRWLQVQIADGGNAAAFPGNGQPQLRRRQHDHGRCGRHAGPRLHGVLIAAGELSEDDVAALLSAA